MSTKILQHAIDLMYANFLEDDIDFVGPLSIQTIDSAEKILEVKFPESYKAFLLILGCGNFSYKEFNGLVRDEIFSNTNLGAAGSLNIVWHQLKNRAEYNLPLQIIQIYHLGDGSYYALDLSQMNAEGECPVVYWPLDGYEATPKLEIVAKDFGEFFLNMVLEEIKNQKRKDGA
ncbi:MAG: SMI1/KNR4 family protein [Alphaproteobacteria bacterium]|nr:SMI1/KNR4 family protein [Alphaproteobacteria bacterium]